MENKSNWKKALDDYLQIIKKKLDEKIHSVYLYGSRAREDAELGSDIDLLLVLRDTVETSEVEKESDKTASELSLKYNVVISLYYTHKTQFEQRFEPLLINIRKEGLKVA